MLIIALSSTLPWVGSIKSPFGVTMKPTEVMLILSLLKKMKGWELCGVEIGKNRIDAQAVQSSKNYNAYLCSQHLWFTIWYCSMLLPPFATVSMASSLTTSSFKKVIVKSWGHIHKPGES